MQKYLFILLLICIPLGLFAQNNPIKVKVTQSDGIVKTRILLDKRDIVKNKAKTTSNFYTHLMAKTKDKMVFNISIGPHISQSGIFHFKFRNTMKAKNIEFYLTDNHGIQKKLNIPIAESIKGKIILRIPQQTHYERIHNYRADQQNIWKAKSSDNIIKKLYGSTHFIKNKIEVFTPEISINLKSIPLSIKSDIKLESIAVMTDAHAYPTIAVIDVPSNGIVDYFMRIVLPATPEAMHIIVVGKGVDGKLYKTIRKIHVETRSGESCG